MIEEHWKAVTKLEIVLLARYYALIERLLILIAQVVVTAALHQNLTLRTAIAMQYYGAQYVEATEYETVPN